MSAPPGRPRRPPPLHERSQSQNNSHAIRIVPYTPPRLDNQQARTASQSSSQSQGQQPPPPAPPESAAASASTSAPNLAGAGNDDDQGSIAGASSRTKRSGEDFRNFKGYASSQGSALSSASSSAVLLAAAKDDVVSGTSTKPASVDGGPRTPSKDPQRRPPPAPAIRTPTRSPARSPTKSTFFGTGNSSNISNLSTTSGFNAPPPQPLQPPPRQPPTVPAPRLQGQGQGQGQAEGQQFHGGAAEVYSVAALGASPPPVPRPRSRRRNFVALHSDSKTFSLVPHGSGGGRRGSADDAGGSRSGRDSAASGSHGRQSDLSNLSSSLGGSSGVTSPPLSMSTVRTSGSHERLSDAFLSDAFSDDRPSSPLSTAGTIPDRTHYPFTPSPGSPTTQLGEDLITTSSSSPWNYRMVGGLRKVPKTPDLKQKKVARLPSSEALSPLFEATPSPKAPSAPPASQGPQAIQAPQAYSVADQVRQNEAEPIESREEEVHAQQEGGEGAAPSRFLAPKESFTSAQTTSTTSETTNYKVYGHSSPFSYPQHSTDSLAQSLPPSSNNSNIQLIGESSPAAPLIDSSPFRPPGSSSSGSDENYVLHGDPSPASSLIRQPRPKFSQESLIVPPLQPLRKKSYEKFGYYKSRSRENLRRANSAKSIQSISSIIASEAAQPFFVAPAFFSNFQPTTGAGPSGSSSSNQQQQQPQQQQQQQQQQQHQQQHQQQQRQQPRPRQQDVSWAGSTPQASGSGSLPQSQRVPMIEAHPHQWSSQLSTVMSETEGSEQGGNGSRSVSRATGSVGGSGNGTGSGSVSGSGSASGNRRNSSGWASSTHSRQMLSISSSLAAQLDDARSHSRSQSHSDSLERPQPTRSRTGQGAGIRTVRDQDEDGDGLADLHNLSNRPSRSGLSAFFHSSDSSSRNLHSSSSSRSFNSASLPTWARVYYGSGARFQLSAMSISEVSEGDSRPGSALRQDPGSPGTDHFPLSIYSPRRRARDVQQPGEGSGQQQRPFSDQASMDITILPPMDDFRIQRGVRKMTSSIWSPHLRMDRRASRYSMWEPPSVSWSAESGMLGRRNVQVVLFILGFIFPFTWMIAALLPLPVDPKLQMLELDHSQSELGVPDVFSRRVGSADEVRYESAKWWRTLNRLMSIVGLIIIGIVVGLVVVGVRQGWYQRP